jgi:prefoldin subunit 5
MEKFQNKLNEIEILNKKISTLQSSMKKLQDDKADLLQLINILSSAPIAAKNVLESYFAKLAGR